MEIAFVMNDYPDLITCRDLPRTKKDLEKIRWLSLGKARRPDIEGLAYRGGSPSYWRNHESREINSR
jgi:hypothetical protein